SLNAFYGMLAIFPVMAIPLLAGGVTGVEFWKVTVVSVNNLLFSLSVGIFCSAISRDERKAIVLAFVIVFFFTGFMPFIDLLRQELWNRQPSAFFFVPSPGYACVAAFDAPYSSMKTKGFGLFYPSVLCVHLMSWALLAAAAGIVPRTWQDR